MSQTIKNLYINDLNSLSAFYGYREVIDNKFYINSDMSIGLDFLPKLAKNTFDIIQSLDGKFKKCLILDLDNTLWGGIHFRNGQLAIGPNGTMARHRRQHCVY